MRLPSVIHSFWSWCWGTLWLCLVISAINTGRPAMQYSINTSWRMCCFSYFVQHDCFRLYGFQKLTIYDKEIVIIGWTCAGIQGTVLPSMASTYAADPRSPFLVQYLWASSSTRTFGLIDSQSSLLPGSSRAAMCRWLWRTWVYSRCGVSLVFCCSTKDRLLGSGQRVKSCIIFKRFEIERAKR